MDHTRDPVERSLGESRDLYEIATWEERSRLDRLAVGVHRWLRRGGRVGVVGVAVLIFVAQLAATGFAVVVDPALGVFTLLSILPAFMLAGYIWYTDVTMRQPLRPLVVTYLLGVLFAGFAAILNTIAQPVFTAIPLVGTAVLFYLVVGPLEETVKWSAVRFAAFSEFESVLDGAVYGAAAGLGFATIENSLYITREFLSASQAAGTAGVASAGVFGAVVGTAAVRSLAGPGHVLYTAISGYYLGLARFNPENAGAIVVKGLLIAAFFHATYDTLSAYLPYVIPFSPAVFIGFVVVYDGVVAGFLLRKLAGYRAAYRDATSVTTESD